MSTSTWRETLPVKSVQDNYVRARVAAINAQADRLKAETIEAFDNDVTLRRAIGEKIPKDKRQDFWATAYDRLTQVLQMKDLTINFKAENWFRSENTFESYTQMYERATTQVTVEKEVLLRKPSGEYEKHTFEMIKDQMALKDAPLNPAITRTVADDRVTIPQEWVETPKPVQGGQKTLGFRPLPPEQRGLMPGQQSPQRIKERMMAGREIVPLREYPSPDILRGVADGAYESQNRRFNPKTKQIFAALNYGCRPLGSNYQYGRSYFILNPKLKANALYYAGDTFEVASTGLQVSYQTLGAIFLFAKLDMRRDLVKSCMGSIVRQCWPALLSTIDMDLLLEAHIFAELRFADGVSEMVVGPTEDESPQDANVLANARKFCEKWGIKFRKM